MNQAHVKSATLQFMPFNSQQRPQHIERLFLHIRLVDGDFRRGEDSLSLSSLSKQMADSVGRISITISRLTPPFLGDVTGEQL